MSDGSVLLWFGYSIGLVTGLLAPVAYRAMRDAWRTRHGTGPSP